MPENVQPAFLQKPLSEMTEAEWESLCDGCGLCCQIRLEDEDTGEIALSNIACRHLCLSSHRCTNYGERFQLVKDCVKITPDNVHSLNWLPATCGYRLVAHGLPLYDWHPLISGSSASVHEDGPSMLGDVVSEDEVDWDNDF